jgi:hypothetical protein
LKEAAGAAAGYGAGIGIFERSPEGNERPAVRERRRLPLGLAGVCRRMPVRGAGSRHDYLLTKNVSFAASGSSDLMKCRAMAFEACASRFPRGTLCLL